MRPLLALLVATTLLLAGCGDTGATSGGSGTSAADAAAPLEFTGTTLDGQTFEGAELAGKPAVLWFWAPWCPTCHGQIPAVTDLATRHEGDVAVVGVGGMDQEKAIRGFAERVPVVTHLVDEEGEVWRHFGVTAQSTFHVLDADGTIVAQGHLGDDELAALVDDLVD